MENLIYIIGVVSCSDLGKQDVRCPLQMFASNVTFLCLSAHLSNIPVFIFVKIDQFAQRGVMFGLLSIIALNK